MCVCTHTEVYTHTHIHTYTYIFNRVPTLIGIQNVFTKEITREQGKELHKCHILRPCVRE